MILKRRLWMIIIIPLVSVLCTWFLSSFVVAPVYDASATLWVIKDGSEQLNYNDLMLSRNLTKTYAEVAESRTVMTKVIDTLGLQGTTVEDLQEQVTVTPVRDTEIIRFSVEDTDAVMAAQIVDRLAETFQEQIRTFMQVENVVMVDPPVVPEKPVKPRVGLNSAVAGVLGLMAALGIAFLLEYLDTSIKTQEDVVRHVGLPVLASIPVLDATGQSTNKRRYAKARRASVMGVKE